jgi:hypothetical protein
MAHGFLARDRVQRMETIKKKNEWPWSQSFRYGLLRSAAEFMRSDSSCLYSGGSSICRSSSANILNSIPKLDFRDYTWTCTQRYLAAEAVKEAAASSHDQCWGRWRWREGDADGMRLVQLLFVQKLWFSDDKAKARMWLVTASHSYSTSN